jgi:hypothetical protein
MSQNNFEPAFLANVIESTERTSDAARLKIEETNIVM